MGSSLPHKCFIFIQYDTIFLEYNVLTTDKQIDLILMIKPILKWTLTMKQPTNKLNIRILSETNLFYLIRHASVNLIVGLHLLRRKPTSEHCWKKLWCTVVLNKKPFNN